MAGEDGRCGRALVLGLHLATVALCSAFWANLIFPVWPSAAPGLRESPGDEDVANRWLRIADTARRRGLVWHVAMNKKGQFNGINLDMDPLGHLLGPSTTAAIAQRHRRPAGRWAALCALRDAILAARPAPGRCSQMRLMAQRTKHGLAVGEGRGYARLKARADQGNFARAEVDGGPSPHAWCTFAECFNATRPACAADGPVRVYVYALFPLNNTHGNKFIRVSPALANVSANARPRPALAIDGAPEFELTDAPEEACLFVVDPGRYRRGEGKSRVPAWRALAHWTAVDGIGGRNHLLLNPNCVEGCDHIGEQRVHGPLGEAATASVNVWRGTARPGMDTAVPMSYSRKMESIIRAYDGDGGMAAPGDAARPLLYAFRGTVKVGTLWYDARALAHVFAPRREDVVVDVKGPFGEDCKQYSPAFAKFSYDSLLRNSSYCLAPGGRGPYSFRFLECIAAGSVPIVPEDTVLPFDQSTSLSKALSWDECVVRVTLAELRALPAVLEVVGLPGSDNFARRRAACHRTKRTLFGPAPEEAAVRRHWRGLFWRELAARMAEARALANESAQGRRARAAQTAPAPRWFR